MILHPHNLSTPPSYQALSATIAANPAFNGTTGAATSMSPPSASPSSTNSKLALAIGLGVGLGVASLAAVAAAVYIFVFRGRSLGGSEEGPNKGSSSTRRVRPSASSRANPLASFFDDRAKPSSSNKASAGKAPTSRQASYYSSAEDPELAILKNSVKASSSPITHLGNPDMAGMTVDDAPVPASSGNSARGSGNVFALPGGAGATSFKTTNSLAGDFASFSAKSGGSNGAEKPGGKFGPVILDAPTVYASNSHAAAGATMPIIVELLHTDSLAEPRAAEGSRP